MTGLNLCDGRGRERVKRRCLPGCAALALAVLSGCACPELEGMESKARPAESGEQRACSIEAIEKRSRLSRELAGSADPSLLAEARRDAERACEAQRLRSVTGWYAAELK